MHAELPEKLKESFVLTLLAAMLFFGVFMGLIFPFVVSPFVEWRSGMRIWFSLLSLVAGLAVGGVSIFLVKTFLLRKISVVGQELRESETSEFLPLQDFEKQYILEVLRETRGVIYGPKGAASILDLKPSTLQSRMKKLGINRADIM